jgi:hypothetical protein
LANENVLDEAIRAGLNSTEYFAFASGFDGKRCIDLKFNQYVGIVEHSGYLVKILVAQKQLADEAAAKQKSAALTPCGADKIVTTVNTGSEEGATNTSGGDSDDSAAEPVPAAPKNTRFFMSADLDTTRINRDVQKYVEEIIQHLTSVDGAKVKVSLEVEAETSGGFTQQTVRTISENCRTLRVRGSGFEG